VGFELEEEEAMGEDQVRGGPDAGAGRGRGPWNAKGVQAAQSGDIEALKALVADMATRLDAIEGGDVDTPTDPEVPVEPVPVEPEVTEPAAE
jgi:hypothetical protein